MRLTQATDFGNEDGAIRIVGPFQAEIFAPVEQKVGRSLVGQGGAEAAEVLGVLLVEEDCLKVQLIQQGEPAKAVVGLDLDGRAGITV